MKSLANLIIFIVVLGIIGAGLFFYPGSPLYFNKTITTIETVQTDSGTPEETTDMFDNGEADLLTEASETSDEIVAVTSSVQIEKSLGADNAPIVIHEYSSLSCGHCGTFHKTVYPDLKKNYIETGKVKIVMVDFPLNLPALQGAMLGHCMPDANGYFDFLQLLYTTQDVWLSGDYLANLKQNAQLAGLSIEDINACLENKDLEDAILARMEQAQAKWEVSSTPTFIINDGAEKVVGTKSYMEFAATLETILIDDAAKGE